jgi:hypothetical protein
VSVTANPRPEREDLRDLLIYLEGHSSPPFPNGQAAYAVRIALADLDAMRALLAEGARDMSTPDRLAWKERVVEMLK